MRRSSTRRTASRPSVHANSAALRHNVIDATCPLVTKVHVQARRYADDGYTVILIGHAGHEEVVGTMGEAPEATILVQDVAEAEALDLPADARIAYITQTTLSVDETSEIIAVLRRRFPQRLRAAQGGHLLRDLQPAVGGEGDAGRDRPPARARLEELLELEPARRRRARGRGRRPSDRRRDRDRRALARGRAHGRHLLRAPRRRSGSSPGSATGSASAASSASTPFQMVAEDVTFKLPVELRRELTLAESQR